MLEIGGQWVSPDQDALIETLDDLGLETYSRYREGENVYIDAERRAQALRGRDLPGAGEDRGRDRRPHREARRARRADRPRRAVGAPQGQGARRDLVRALARDADRRRGSAPEHRHVHRRRDAHQARHAFSALQALLMAASAGSFSNLVDADFILDKRVVGGLQQVPLLLAERLGDDVLLGQPVRTLGRALRRRAVPPAGRRRHDRARAVRDRGPRRPILISRISFEPPLPRRQHQLHQHLSMGFVIKVHAVYETPFWRDAGLSRHGVQPLRALARGLRQHEPRRPARHARRLRLRPAGRRRVRADRRGAQGAHPRVAVALLRRPRRRTRSCTTRATGAARSGRAAPTPRASTSAACTATAPTCATPVGPIHFACSDMAGEGYQHVDGAIRMGRLAAAHIIEEARA